MADNREQAREIQRLRDEVDDYLQSVYGLYMFGQSALWDEDTRSMRDGHVSVGRSMTRHVDTGDGVEKLTVTPDAVVQVKEDYGVVAEMRCHFRKGETEKFDQVKKYDDSLAGWWSPDEEIESYDLVLLTHMESSAHAISAFARWKEDGGRFGRHFAVVEFAHSSRGQGWYFLRVLPGGGKLSDGRHTDHLQDGKKMPTWLLAKVMSKYKFYDDPPPLLHTLTTIQDGILPLLFSAQDYDESTGGVRRTVETTASEIRHLLQQQYCDSPEHRGRDLPRIAWVRSALTALGQMRLARRIESDDGEEHWEIVLKKPPRGDSLEFFAKRLLGLKKKGRGKGSRKMLGTQTLQQASLFAADEGSAGEEE